jgi:hemerythrin-like metal-binding protein
VLDYCRDHFSAEEALLKAHEYPGLAEHHAIHNALTQLAGEYAARYKRGDETLYIPLLKSMRDSISQHILVEDMKYARWMKEHGVR